MEAAEEAAVRLAGKLECPQCGRLVEACRAERPARGLVFPYHTEPGVQPVKLCAKSHARVLE